MKIQNVVGALALALSDNITRAAYEAAPEPGPAAAAIALLGHVPGLPIEPLRRALGLSHPGAVRLIDRLVAEGLVLRHPNPNDRRAVALHLTRAGKQRCAAILRSRQKRLAHALGSLDPTERKTLGRLSEKLLASYVDGLGDAYAVCRLCDPGVCSDCPVEAALGDKGT